MVALRLCLVVFVFQALAACSSGIAEFQLYDQAFDTQFNEGTKALDRLAGAERTLLDRREKRKGGLATFDPDQAAYYVNVGDPPLTGAIRASLKSVQDYNKALSGLANGEAAKSLSNRIGTLSSSILSTASAWQTALGSIGVLSGAAPGAQAFAEGGQAIITRLLPVFEQVTGFAHKAAFRRQLLKAYPDMRELLVRLKGGTSDMYEVMKRSYVKRGGLGGGRLAGISAVDQIKLKADRKLLAGWVVLIDRSLIAMDAAAHAALSGASDADIATLVETSIELRILAEKIKTASTSN